MRSPLPDWNRLNINRLELSISVATTMFTLKFYAILNNSLVRQIAVCYESEMIFVKWTSRMIVGLSAIALTGTSVLGDTSIAVPDFGFDTDGPSITAFGFESGVWTHDNNRYYTNQNPGGANPYPDAELFAGWVNTDTNEQAYETSTAGMSGLAMGITSAVQVNNSVGNTTVSLNPVVSSIDANAIYKFTLSLAAGGSTSSNVTMELVSTTSASDPTNYNVAPLYYTTSTTLTGTQSDLIRRRLSPARSLNRRRSPLRSLMTRAPMPSRITP
jgi:hypothetical protein